MGAAGPAADFGDRAFGILVVDGDAGAEAGFRLGEELHSVVVQRRADGGALFSAVARQAP